MSIISKVIASLTMAGFYAAMVVLIIMMLMVTTEAVIRSIFGLSMMVADEFAGYCGVWFVCLGLGYSVRNHALMRVDVLYRRLGNFPQKILQVIFDLVSIVISMILCYEFAHLWLQSIRTGVKSVSQAEIPLWIPQVVMPIGMGIVIVALLLELGQNTGGLLKRIKEDDRNDGKMEPYKERPLP